MNDPIAAMDQAKAGIWSWAEMLAYAVDQLEARGFSRDEALYLAENWMLMVQNAST